MFLSTIFCALYWVSLVSAKFGDPLSHGVDDLFDVMGQATIDEWNVDAGNVVLNIETEMVIGQDEIWVLDFQAYEMADGSTPIDDSAPANLMPEKTGSCSNIFANTMGFYKDTYSPAPPGTKDLYNAFTKGSPSDGRRFDNYTYTGDVDTLLECTNTDAEKVWVHKVYEDYVEFNATLYMTNVRPKYINKPVAASYIESYVVLYWRLLRVALSRFLISSTERLRPVFQYAIVSTVYVNDDASLDVDRSRAHVELVFKTVTDSDGELISVYRYGSLVYTSPNTKNTLSHIKLLPSRGCSSALGVRRTRFVAISDAQMTATTELSAASDGRLYGEGFWAPSSADTSASLTIDLREVKYISGIQTQGSKYSLNYVTDYEVRYYTVTNDWRSLGTFSGNFDSDTVVTNMFDVPVEANIVRIFPLASVNDKAMRVEILGCPTEGRQAEHLDLVNTPVCDYIEFPGQCTQLWQFSMVLNVDEGSVSNNMPIDATGNFQFQYETYRCDNASDVGYDTCEQLQIPDAVVSHEITLQTTVQLTDSEKDKPWLVVTQVYGDDSSVNLIGGYRPGVSHLETVTIELEFYPQFLRTQVGLELMLFMVCIGEQYQNDPDGCFSAPADDSYTAYVHEDFSFTMSTGVDLVADNITPSSQTLATYSYDWSDELYTITFVNKALSARTRDYTITTVFRLVPAQRKRRDISDDMGLLTRDRRDLQTNAKKQQLSTVTMKSRGCPITATHDPIYLECLCMNGYAYSKEHYDCIVPEVELVQDLEDVTTPVQKDAPPVAKPVDITEKQADDSAASSITSAPILLFVATIIARSY